MTYLNAQIQELDAIIEENLPKDCGISRWTVKKHGLCEAKFNQNANAILLHDSEGNKVTIDDAYDLQLIHVHNNMTAILDEMYGGFPDNSCIYGMKLIALTKKKTVLERVVKAFEQHDSTILRRVQVETETVLKNELKIKVGQDKNYPPEYKAMLFFYDFLSVEPVIEDEL